MQLLLKYYPEIQEDERIIKFKKLQEVYAEWNQQINVISRKDFDEFFYERHVLHSLALIKGCDFFEGARVLDVGTGGGFPGIPLAIMYPKVHFTLVDSIGKKIKVVQAVADALELNNVTALNQRAEQVQGKFHYIVSRAVTRLPVFKDWVKNKLVLKLPPQANSPAGIYYLKGGDLSDEIDDTIQILDIIELKDYFKEEFFETKKIVICR